MKLEIEPTGTASFEMFAMSFGRVLFFCRFEKKNDSCQG